MSAPDVKPLWVDRETGAVMFGVSVDHLKSEQRAGRIPAKNTKVDKKTGRAVGKTLYRVADLEAWAEGLDDA